MIWQSFSTAAYRRTWVATNGTHWWRLEHEADYDDTDTLFEVTRFDDGSTVVREVKPQ